MAKSDITSKDWCELVFDQKNKDYGAYVLRQELPQRHLWGLLLTIGIAILIVLLPMLISLIPEEKADVEEYLQVTELATLEEAEIKDESFVQKVDLAPPPPPLASSIKFDVPLVVDDSQVTDNDNMRSQEDVARSRVAISIADIKGNDDVRGADIRDVRTVVVQADPKKVDEDRIYETVQQRASFPGGNPALYKWLGDNLVFPAMSLESNTQGTVNVRFVVSTTGAISNVQIVKSLDPYCDREALRVVQRMPNWTPARQDGVVVRSYFTLPIQFRID